jgi:hypothetical protein
MKRKNFEELPIGSVVELKRAIASIEKEKDGENPLIATGTILSLTSEMESGGTRRYITLAGKCTGSVFYKAVRRVRREM